MIIILILKGEKNRKRPPVLFRLSQLCQTCQTTVSNLKKKKTKNGK